MPETLTSLGVGGILVYLVIKELFSYLKAKRNGNGHETSGSKDPSYWKETLRQIVEEAIEHEFAARNEKLRQLIREEISRLRR
jgi:hypothetical protein